jgi:hypothetical protein
MVIGKKASKKPTSAPLYLDEKLPYDYCKMHPSCQDPGCLYDVIRSSRSTRRYTRNSNRKKGWRRKRRKKKTTKTFTFLQVSTI